MDGCNGEGTWGTPINSFSLVSYFPEPLGRFLDRLRSDLVADCHAKAHLTVLPPRSLGCPVDEAWKELKAGLRDFSPFHVALKDIEVFEPTQVIYVSVGMGYDQLEHMHRVLNAGRLEFKEPYEYHPHVTVAQDLAPGCVAAAKETAIRRWREFPHRRDFTVDQLTFVRNTEENRWTDLARFALDHSNVSI